MLGTSTQAPGSCLRAFALAATTSPPARDACHHLPHRISPGHPDSEHSSGCRTENISHLPFPSFPTPPSPFCFVHGTPAHTGRISVCVCVVGACLLSCRFTACPFSTGSRRGWGSGSPYPAQGQRLHTAGAGGRLRAQPHLRPLLHGRSRLAASNSGSGHMTAWGPPSSYQCPFSQQ